MVSMKPLYTIQRSMIVETRFADMLMMRQLSIHTNELPLHCIVLVDECMYLRSNV